MARERLGERELAPRLRLLMRDVIISDALEDAALMRAMSSDDMERSVAAFKNFYEDYKNHLPDSLGLKLEQIKGLREAFDDISKSFYAETARSKRQAGLVPQYRSYHLVPQGFLSVFRGRACITDCSFDEDKGKPYTRAMHEDTIYYFVYKGKELKGYIGLLLAQTNKGRKILTVDTINSPSLDGSKLLMELFSKLQGLAQKLGAEGIALPADIGPSFNFENENTIKKMPIYRKAPLVHLTPVHLEHWKRLTDMYGEDTYNSIENGKFRLLTKIH